MHGTPGWQEADERSFRFGDLWLSNRQCEEVMNMAWIQIPGVNLMDKLVNLQ